jgi:hypothetical protein
MTTTAFDDQYLAEPEPVLQPYDTGSILPLSHFPTHWRPAQSADHSERNLEKVAPDCRNCANRGRVNGLSQESYCDGCVYEGRDWRKNHFVDAVNRRCEACAILPCSCK